MLEQRIEAFLSLNHSPREGKPQLGPYCPVLENACCGTQREEPVDGSGRQTALQLLGLQLLRVGGI